jgi:hypothetical protein
LATFNWTGQMLPGRGHIPMLDHPSVVAEFIKASAAPAAGSQRDGPAVIGLEGGAHMFRQKQPAPSATWLRRNSPRSATRPSTKRLADC